MKVLKTYKPKLTQGYSSSHTGNDIVGNKDGKSVLDTIVAIADGKVTQVINTCNVNTNGKDGHKLDKSNPGNLVKIEHANGYVTRYLHGVYKSVKVKVGDKVKAGQAIMSMGNTGYSFGGHLHLDMWLNGKKIDPYDYVFKDKTFDVLPKPVDRDNTVEQLQVVANQLNCRIDHKTTATSLGFCPKGIYNILYRYNDGKYTWYEIEKDKWVASEGTWAILLEPVKEEIEEPQNKPIEEQKQEDSIKTLEDTKTSENEEIKQELDDIPSYYEEKENVLLWIIQKIIELIKELFNKKSDK